MKSAPRIRWRAQACEPLADLHPVLARVLAARGVRAADDLDFSLTGLPAPELAGLDAAVERLAHAHAAGESVLVIGDFDADGATAVALALKGLPALGFGQVDYLVPDRFALGYGLTPELAAIAAERGPDLLLTVDNGISSHAGIEAAADRGIDTVVTDHHLPGAELPRAVAVVNPNRPDCVFPCKNLAGVGVVFYLLVALRARLSAAGVFAGAAPNLADYLDLVALGTVADLVPLDRTNRILVEQGLRRIRAGHGSPGVHALLAVARREAAEVTAGDLGYAVAPRLNAAGRLADMSLGIETLLADGPGPAEVAAERLDTLNRERREIEAEMRGQAEAELTRLRGHFDGESLPAAIVLHDERWHEGVIGILAGRVRETVHRPTVVFAEAEADGRLKGSARSVAGLHIRDALARVAATEPELLERFGGHAMAAGLQIRAQDLQAFRKALVREVERALGAAEPVQEIETDGELAPEELVLETAEALRCAGPWGVGFPEPLFHGDFEVQACRSVATHHLKLTLRPDQGGRGLNAIAFNAAPEWHHDPGRRLRLVYRLDVDRYGGRRRPQLVIEHMARLPEPPGD